MVAPARTPLPASRAPPAATRAGTTYGIAAGGERGKGISSAAAGGRRRIRCWVRVGGRRSASPSRAGRAALDGKLPQDARRRAVGDRAVFFSEATA